jgi:alpha-glucoside transport system substrate-binding protein
MTRHWSIRLLALLFSFTLIAAACGDDDDAAGEGDGDGEGDGTSYCSTIAEGGEGDLAGETVTILGPETDAEAEGFCAGFVGLVESTGVAIEYSGTRDAVTQANVAVEAGNEPADIVMIPQPGRVITFAERGVLTPVPQETLDELSGIPQLWWDFATADGTVYGVPTKADVKSLVWYNPSVWADNGYEIPTTWDEMLALQETIKENGQTPWCIGIESGDATGWTFTDWMEDVMLRINGPEVYDQWVNHEIPFDDPQVKAVAEAIGDIWFEEGNVLGGRDAIATTGFKESSLPLIDGDCMMHRQASFAGSFFVEAGSTIGDESADISVFYLPPASDEFGNVVLSAGVIATAFNDRPATLAVLADAGGADNNAARVTAQGGGYYSPNADVPTDVYPSAADALILDVLFTADAVRFDASDLMPGEVGAGEFWRSGTDYVSGSIDVDTFLETTEAAWPS